MWGWLLLALPFALLTILLAFPLDLVVDARIDERGFRQRTRIEWLFVRKDLEPGARARPPRVKQRKRLDALAMLRTDGFVDALRRAARRMLRSLKIKALELRAIIGLGDPAATGQLMGLLAPLSVLVLSTTAHVSARPDFDRERLDADLHARVRLWPLLAVAAILALVLTPAAWRAFRAGRRA